MPSAPDKHADLEIEVLEARLKALKVSRDTTRGSQQTDTNESPAAAHAALHSLLLLADSALPLGSFAFSAGLESYLAHVQRSKTFHDFNHFKHFVNLSLDSIAAMTLPYVYQTWVTPQSLRALDSELEASTTCVVARRASVAQGRALLTMWRRSLKSSAASGSSSSIEATAALDVMSDSLSREDSCTSALRRHVGWIESPNAHFPPLFGALAAAMGVPLQQALYLYLLNHAKMISSAGIRASVLGPYQSQKYLASQILQTQIDAIVTRQLCRKTIPQDAVQSVPALDIWSGRHELVYSRIFNS
ncbi:MAG: hypothetical protein Q9159_000619 [Coniocarpon cinnabarinum]